MSDYCRLRQRVQWALEDIARGTPVTMTCRFVSSCDYISTRSVRYHLRGDTLWRKFDGDHECKSDVRKLTEEAEQYLAHLEWVKDDNICSDIKSLAYSYRNEYIIKKRRKPSYRINNYNNPSYCPTCGQKNYYACSCCGGRRYYK